MQTILGANGTIGSVLAKELINYTDKIRLVSRNPRKVNESDELFAADLSNPGSVDHAVEGSDVVYLVVGFDYKVKVWEEKWPRLIRATINACLKHNAKLVFFDNVYTYDINAIPHMTEESPNNPPSKKGAVRKQIAGMIMDEVKAGKLMALIARSADFYGPGNDKSFVNEMVYKNFLKGMRAIWFVEADKNTLTGREFVELFSREMKVANKLFVMPLWMIKIVGLFVPALKEMPEMIYQYDRDYFFDSSKFEKRFKFKTTTYQEGVRNTVEQLK